VNWTQATANAGWLGRHGHTSVVFDNKIWVIGGYASDFTYRNDVWYSTNGVNWTQATAGAPWSGRYSHTSVVYDNKMWVIGGYTGVAPFSTNDVWYSTDGANWTQATASAGWSIRSGHTSFVFDNKMWVIGGKVTNDVWYSTDGTTWTQATANAGWLTRTKHTSVIFDNKMWVMGGWNVSTRYNDVWFSTDGITWTQATANAGWSVRYHHTSVVFNDMMWVIGGAYNTGSTLYNDVWYSRGLNGITDNHQTLVANRFSFNAEPNPFKTHTAIRYSLPNDGNVSISIHDILGKIVKTLIDGYKEPGDYIVDWNGKDEYERAVAKGVYFYTLKSTNQTFTKNLVLMK
jgi:hypothetical protein